METKERLPITRKASIYKAILLLEKQKGREEEIAILKELATGMPILQWSEKVAKDCINNFYLDNNRLPTVTDLEKNKELPSHINFKYLFGITARQWLNKNYSSYTPPKSTRKRALQLVVDLLDGEEKQVVQEMLNEYPTTKWNNKNLIDCFVTYYENHNRVPTEDEMEATDELPYYGLFKYKWKTTYLKWLEENIPVLYQISLKQKENNRDYVTEFISEYQRVLPRSEDDFNRRRDKNACCIAEIVKRSLGLRSWKQLVVHCGLELFDTEAERLAKERAKIKSMKVIIVDCGESFFYRQYSKEIERKFLGTGLRR